MMPYDVDYQAISASAIKAAILRRGSTADECVVSMLHMQHAMTKDRREEGTHAQQWGTTCHAAILQPERVRLWAGYTTKKGKLSHSKSSNAWEEFRDFWREQSGVPVNDPEWQKLALVRLAVDGNPSAKYLIEGTQHETPIQWTDKALGRCKGKPDMFAEGVVADLKLLKDCTEEAIDAAIFRAGTDIQLAWYIRGLRSAGLCGQFVRARVIAVQSAPPHFCTVAEITPQVIESAEALAVEIARRYRVHEACGTFPGPARETMTYEPPRWANSNEDWAPNEGNDEL